MIDLVRSAYYVEDSFPRVPVRWACGPSQYYAYTTHEDPAIYFIAPNFRRNWEYNFEIARHEAAHMAVGPGHGHDAVWKREFRRLHGMAARMRVDDIRAAARSIEKRDRKRRSTRRPTWISRRVVRELVRPGRGA
jgi:hypothetical protein